MQESFSYNECFHDVSETCSSCMFIALEQFQRGLYRAIKEQRLDELPKNEIAENWHIVAGEIGRVLPVLEKEFNSEDDFHACERHVHDWCNRMCQFIIRMELAA